jgi:hypothetical protein
MAHLGKGWVSCWMRRPPLLRPLDDGLRCRWLCRFTHRWFLPLRTKIILRRCVRFRFRLAAIVLLFRRDVNKLFDRSSPVCNNGPRTVQSYAVSGCDCPPSASGTLVTEGSAGSISRTERTHVAITAVMSTTVCTSWSLHFRARASAPLIHPPTGATVAMAIWFMPAKHLKSTCQQCIWRWLYCTAAAPCSTRHSAARTPRHRTPSTSKSYARQHNRKAGARPACGPAPSR